MSRSVLLQKIRQACARSSQEGIDLPSGFPEFPDYPERVEQFREELEGVGGIFDDARSEGALPEILTRILREAATTHLYWEGASLFEKHSIPFTLRNPEAFAQGHLVYSYHFRGEVKFPLTLSSRPYQRESLQDIAVSASSALYGVAETGTIVHQVRTGAGRLLSVLPPVHIAFLSEAGLLMNHAELFTRLSPGDEGSALTLITGPSRTADIEKTLVIGVHGPHKWHVILTLRGY